MLRTMFRLSLVLALPALGCKPPPAAETTPPVAVEQPEEDEEQALPDAKMVLAKSIEAVGGAAAIEAIASSYTESTTEIKAQNFTVVTKIWSKGTNFYVESDMPGMGKTQVWKKGDDVWSKDVVGGLRQLEGAEAAQARWSADPLLAAHWEQYFDTATTVARTEEGDRTLVEIELSTADGEQKLGLLFDAESYLPAGQTFTQQTQMGPMPIRITFEDYREVAGVMTSFRAITDMQLMNAVQTTDKYEVNVEVDDAKFEPPKG